MTVPRHSGRGLKAAAIVGILFGILTIISGGSALFGSAEARASLGNTVPFVLWFNFLAGFVYIVAGTGLFLQKRWAMWLSIILFVATALVFAAFGVHVLWGGLYEMRTLGALVLRTTLWAIISAIAFKAFQR